MFVCRVSPSISKQVLFGGAVSLAPVFAQSLKMSTTSSCSAGLLCLRCCLPFFLSTWQQDKSILRSAIIDSQRACTTMTRVTVNLREMGNIPRDPMTDSSKPLQRVRLLSRQNKSKSRQRKDYKTNVRS